MIASILCLATYTIATRAAASRHKAMEVNSQPSVTNNFNCTAKLDGRPVGLRLGEGIRTADGRLECCDSYDGHSLIIYLAASPKEAARGIVKCSSGRDTSPT
jgi:hypothetical protein